MSRPSGGDPFGPPRHGGGPGARRARLLESARMQVRMRRPVATRPAGRRVRAEIRRVDPWSLLKFSLLFYGAIMTVFVIVSMIVFWVASAVGVVGNLENIIQGVGWPTFRVRGIQVFRALILVGVVMMVVWSAINVIAAFLYNLVSDVVGGVEITLSDRHG